MVQNQGLKDLRKLWQQALEDNAPGADAEEVLTRLEQKYQRQADATS